LALDIDECQQALLAYPFAAGSVLLREPAGQNKKETTWHFDLCTTASWSSASRVKRRPKAESSSPIPQRRSLRKVRSSLWVPEVAMKPASSPPSTKAGDRVLFGKWSGTEVKIDGEELLIMKESDILGIGPDGSSHAVSLLRS
jgi:hypothetical protein